jgi:hypothetical protein
LSKKKDLKTLLANIQNQQIKKCQLEKLQFNKLQNGDSEENYWLLITSDWKIPPLAPLVLGKELTRQGLNLCVQQKPMPAYAGEGMFISQIICKAGQGEKSPLSGSM